MWGCASCEMAPFAFEPEPKLRVGRDLGGQDLEGDRAVEFRIASAVDPPMPPAPMRDNRVRITSFLSGRREPFMSRTLAAFITTGLALAAGTLAQQQPDFFGRWVVVEPATGAGSEQLVSYDIKANTLMLEHDSEGHGHKLVYKLDGTESRNALASHGSEIVILSKAQWTGNQITITGVATYPDGRRMQSRQVWSMDASGQLIVDVMETMDGRQTTARTVHKKR
jgi:hypothetical protein